MRIGIFGSSRDGQSTAVKKHIESHGIQCVLVESQGLSKGFPCSFNGQSFFYNKVCLDDVGSWYLRFIMSPLPPTFYQDQQFKLYKDWYFQYMRIRERYAFQVSWLSFLAQKGIPVVNSPLFVAPLQLKAYQLAVANQQGLIIPRTLISNDPEQVRVFIDEVEEVVYKPSMGGGLCKALTTQDLDYLELIKASPVTFQEKIKGSNIRITIVGKEVVSAVKLPTSSLDYRDDPDYKAGKQEYEEVEVNDLVKEQSLNLMKACGLTFSGIDYIFAEDGRAVFLEANSSPVYYDIEQKTGHPISKKIAEYLIQLANDPGDYSHEKTLPTQSFLAYGNPFQPRTSFERTLE